MDDATPIAEDDIQAFVDDRLDAVSRDRVLRHLASTPEDARRVEDYRTQRQALRDALRPIAAEPVPARLARTPTFAWEDCDRGVSPLRLRRGAARAGWSFGRSPFAQAACVALVCLAAGGAFGWCFATLRSPWNTGVRPLAEEAADSYRAYVSDAVRPVEISSADMAALTAWTSSRLGRKVAAPGRIEGLSLLGGRVVPTSRGPAAMFMYTDAKGHGSPAVLLVCPLSLHGNAPMVDGVESKLASVTWSVGGVGYSLVGNIPVLKLRSMAEDARRAFGRDA